MKCFNCEHPAQLNSWFCSAECEREYIEDRGIDSDAADDHDHPGIEEE